LFVSPILITSGRNRFTQKRGKLLLNQGFSTGAYYHPHFAFRSLPQNGRLTPVKIAPPLLAPLAAVIVCLIPLPAQAETFEETRAKAEQGDAEAQYILGWRYDNGLDVEKDEFEAVKWFRKAAEQGDVNAQYNLSVCYENGQGVMKNDLLAYQWNVLACANGKKAAKDDLPALEEKLTAEQRAEGQRLATEWQAAFEKRQAEK
jgi:TPR repeat protein